MSRHVARRPLLACLSALALTVALITPAAADDDGELQITTVATGLDNPRGMDVAENGAVFVAEAGEGGTAYSYTHPFFGSLSGGPSGAITRIWRGTQARVVTGLPSIGGSGGAFADGPEDVSLRENGNMFVPIGFGGPPGEIDLFPASGQAHGWLIKAQRTGTWQLVADLAQFELDHNPVPPFPDTNPKSVEAVHGGRAVVDAGGNDLLWVDSSGAVSLLATFDTRGFVESVPTSVARGPDGAFYVGELTGVPYPTGFARVWRVVPGQPPQVHIGEGWFTNIMDLAFDEKGNLYVLEIDHDGLQRGADAGGLWRVPKGGGDPELLLTDPLVLPGGIGIGEEDESIFVSTCAPCANAGTVLRIDLDD